MSRLKRVAMRDEPPIKPSLDDPRFKPHEFETVQELFQKRHGWIPPSKREHPKAIVVGETRVFIGSLAFGEVKANE